MIEMASWQAKPAIMKGAAPENLTVSGSLYLRGCTGLTALPENLTVSDYLDLRDCTGLQHLRLGTDLRGYEFYAIPAPNGVRVVAGCRNFTLKQALSHWSDNPECLAFVEAARERQGVPA